MEIRCHQMVWCLILAILPLLAACGRREDGTPIVVSPEGLDVGSVWAVDGYPWELCLSNRSDRIVEIVDVKPSCGCTSISPRSLSLAPGESKHVRLTFQLGAAQGVQDATRETDLKVQVSPIIRGFDGHEPVWVLHGRIRPVLKISQPSVRFDDEQTQWPAFASKKVLIESVAQLKSLEAKCDAELGTVELTKHSDTSFSLSVVPNPSRPPGRFEFSVTLVATLPSGQSARVSIPVFGRAAREVDVSRDRLVLGEAKIGATLEQVVEFRARSSVSFRAEPVASDCPGMEVQMRSSADGRVTAVVRQKVVRTGHQNGQVKFLVRVGSKPAFEIALPIYYYGLES